MGKFNPDNYTKPQLLEALAKAGITGASRARKEELAAMCIKLKGKTRAVVVDALQTSSSKGSKTVKPPEKAKPAPKKPEKKTAAAPKAASPKHVKKQVEHPIETARLAEELQAPISYPQAAILQVPPPPGDFPLPESYGIDMFHVLVFDPYGAYIFWELSPELLGRLYATFGDERWRSRKLIVRATTAAGKLITQELYGERGSYFMNVQEPGQIVSFELGFMIWDRFQPVSPVRAIAFPRDRASEEMTVTLLEVKQAEASLSLRELAAEEALKLILEPLGDDYRSEGAEGPMPNSAENIKRGDDE